MSTVTVVEQTVRARIVASAPRVEPVRAVLRYETHDPFAVRMGFPADATLEGNELAWAFARELLAAGMERPAGDGDVRIRPYGYDRTVVEFHAPEGVAVVHIRTSEVRRFLDRVQRLVPAGDEGRHLDLDHDLAELLRDAR
ncbi:SsgA family sporulation/cell division regulator [Streptomyces sp. NPDC058953]|uniref:SsgA family sporulation/cell division regulator n=1 Tax=unclassified Streptomyces TaxID=2593676 RepID=UPI0036D04FCD